MRHGSLADPDVGVIGCVGAIGVRSIAWWEGSVTLASFVQRFHDHGGGDLPAFSWVWDEAPPYARIGEVDTVDGFVLVLPRWTVENLRFDESLGQFHGYDFDFCLQVRAAGYKVVTADFKAVHSHSLIPFVDPESWVQAHIAVADKWDGRMPGVGTATGTWLERARRAEAMRDSALLVDHANELQLEAQLRELERALEGWAAHLLADHPATAPGAVRDAFRTRGTWRRFRTGARTGGVAMIAFGILDH